MRDPDEHEKMLRLFVVIFKHTTKDDLRNVFEVMITNSLEEQYQSSVLLQKYGSIIHIKVIVDKLTGENKGFAYISFSKASEAAYALEECDPTYKPKFAEPFSSKRHRDAEETLPSSASLYGAFSPPHRRLNKSHPSPTYDRRLSPPPSLSRIDSISPAYHLLENNNERRLIIRCGMTITKYHISKLFDLVPNMEECSALSLTTSNERK